MIIFLFIKICFYFKKFFRSIRKNKFFKAKNYTYFNKNDLNNWMNLTKKERYKQLNQESLTYMNRRKVLLEEIRNEYKRVSEGDSNKT